MTRSRDNADQGWQEHSNPNLIINGDMSVWQRGAAFPSGGGTAGYCADRFYKYNTTSVDRSFDVRSGGPCLYSATVLSSGGIGYLLQTVELDITGGMQPFQPNEDYTYSFYAKTTTSALLTVFTNFQDTASGGNAVTIWSDTATAPDGGWNKYTFTFNTGAVGPAGTSTNVAIGVGSPDGVQMNVTEFKLERGSVATPFIPDDPATNLAKCQRYYERVDVTNGTGANLISNGFWTTSTGGVLFMDMRVTKRSIPTLVHGGTKSVNNAGSVYTITGFSQNVGTSTLDCMALDYTTASGGTAGYATRAYSVDPTCFIAADAEL